MTNHDRKPDKIGDDDGSGRLAHEEAARDSTQRVSWLHQLRRVFRLSKGRPYGEDEKRK